MAAAQVNNVDIGKLELSVATIEDARALYQMIVGSHNGNLKIGQCKIDVDALRLPQPVTV